MNSTDQTIEHGVLIAGRYRVKKLLGRGGMGRVYLVSDTLLESLEEGALVAMKILRDDLAADERYRRRFLREVALTRGITHRNVIRTFEVGRDGERLFFTMEYIDGAPLDRQLIGEPLEARGACAILADVASGLQAIHAIGVLHRDLKPANVILTKSGEVKISDFGIAKAAVSDLTQKHEVLGSAYYMAPEVWKGDDVGTPADVYALGVLAYELFTGVVPFDGAVEPEVMWKHFEEPPVQPLLLVPTVPAWISELIVAMLSKEPENRPDVGEVIRRIQSNSGELGAAAGSSENLAQQCPAVFEGSEVEAGVDESPRQPETAGEVGISLDAPSTAHQRRRIASIISIAGELLSEQGPTRWYAPRAAGVAAFCPAIALTLLFVVLPQIERSWSTIAAASAGYFVGLSVLLFLSVGLLCATPAFLAAAFTGNLNRAVDLYYTITSRFTTLCGFWYIGLHVFQRIGLNPRGHLTTLRATMTGVVELVSQQALRAGLLVPLSPPIGSGETLLGIKYPMIEQAVYLAVLSIYFFWICGGVTKILGFGIDRRLKTVLWVLIGVIPQTVGYWAVQFALANPGSIIGRRVVWRCGPLLLDCTVAGLLTGALMWSLLILTGALLAMRACREVDAPPYVPEPQASAGKTDAKSN